VLSSSSDPEQALDELRLPLRITSRQPFDLTLPDHVDRFNAPDGWLRRPPSNTRTIALSETTTAMASVFFEIDAAAKWRLPSPSGNWTPSEAEASR
jgi:hypothetical protein